MAVRTRAPIELILLVSGLLGPAGAGSGDPDAVRALVDGLDLDGLDRLLARSKPATAATADDSLEALAFRSFGYAALPAGTDWPVAAVTALVDCDAGGSEFRLRADPVHLHADIADLVLFKASDVHVSRDEAAALARTVNQALGAHGPCIDAAHPHRWYVALDAPARIVTTPLSLAAGARVSPAMPRGPDASRWHRWMNEVQMALHECPVNVERERRGAAPINSVWPWGAGNLPPAPEAPVPLAQAWSDDVLVHGLARHAGIEHGATPAGAREWLSDDPRPGVHRDRLRRPASGGAARGHRRVARRGRAPQRLVGAAAARCTGPRRRRARVDSRRARPPVYRDPPGTLSMVASRWTRGQDRRRARPDSLRRYHLDDGARPCGKPSRSVTIPTIEPTPAASPLRARACRLPSADNLTVTVCRRQMEANAPRESGLRLRSCLAGPSPTVVGRSLASIARRTRERCVAQPGGGNPMALSRVHHRRLARSAA